jgi:addiction module HigA family antidote
LGGVKFEDDWGRSKNNRLSQKFAITIRRTDDVDEAPPHPGRIVRQECIEALGLTVTAAARGLGVTRKALSELVNGKSGISPEMAVRLSKAFGSSPELQEDRGPRRSGSE